jgi:hypothetical protein
MILELDKEPWDMSADEANAAGALEGFRLETELWKAQRRVRVLKDRLPNQRASDKEIAAAGRACDKAWSRWNKHVLAERERRLTEFEAEHGPVRWRG